MPQKRKPTRCGDVGRGGCLERRNDNPDRRIGHEGLATVALNNVGTGQSPIKAGMNPVSPDKMYMFLREPVKEFVQIADGQLHTRLGELMAPYGGVVEAVLEKLNRPY